MSEKKFDWTKFKRRIFIRNTSKEELFKKWTTPKGLTEWFIKKANYKDENGQIRSENDIIQPGDKYSWQFHIGSKIEGIILEVKENELIKFTFGKKEPESNDEVVVTVTFHEKDGKTFFDIIQENMSENNYGRVNSYISCNLGWVFHMNNLKSLIENSRDIRIKSKERMHVDTPSGYPLESYKWTEFKYNEYYNAPLTKIFRKWTTPGDIITWFIAEATYEDDKGKIRDQNEIVQPGDVYHWKFFQGITMKGEILDVVENKLVKFTFGKKEPNSDEDVVVTVSFKENMGTTHVLLHQNNIANNDFGHISFNVSCIIGWSYFMTNLRSLVETGYDLREKDEKLALESRATTL
ncbi:MAG: SRPBCC domain-containing protein [Candidatus Hodarchaeales archaeon]|jgi:uncharacterized protein YndB with AHSA1/START domain